MKTMNFSAWLDAIEIGPRHRALDETKVAALADSMARIGLQHPITVWIERKEEDGEEIVHLVAGLHRVKAALRLGWEQIDAVHVDVSAIDRELWEIAENLHRVDLTKEERDAHIRRYGELLEAREAEEEEAEREVEIQVVQNDPPEIGYKKPPPQKKGIARKIADQTGLSKSTVRRALDRDPERQRRTAERRRERIDRKAAAEQERREQIAAEREAERRERQRAAEDYAEWLFARCDLDHVPTLIAWIENADPRAIIDALQRLRVEPVTRLLDGQSRLQAREAAAAEKQR